MKITTVEAYPVSIPYRVPWRNRHTEERGKPMTHLETCVLKVNTDEGLWGLGEARAEGAAQAARARFEPFLAGRNPFDIAGLVLAMEAEFGRSALVAGIDFALHDIVGKALGAPVYQLIGGKVRERVPLVWTLPYLDIEEQVAAARARVEEGFTHAVKMKVGVPGDIEHVLAVGRAIGDVPLRPDSNMGHDRDEAREQLVAILEAGVRLELVEDPCPANWDDYQELADALDVGISVHGGWSSFEDLTDLIRAAKPGIRCVNVMPTDWGIYRTAQIVAALECAGIGWTMGTSHNTSIKTAAALHLGVALPNRLYPADLLGARLHAGDVVEDPPRVEAGYGAVSERSGLGVELSAAALERYALPE